MQEQIPPDHAPVFQKRNRPEAPPSEALPMSALGTAAPWDLVAEGYSDVTMGLTRAYSDAALERVPVRKGDHVADIACGPGTLALAAAARGATVTAVDFSANMIAQLERNAAARGLDGVRAHHGDGQALPFEDGSFDAAFSMFGLMFFPDRARGHAEMHRTLKPGRSECVASWGPMARSPLLLTMFEGLRQVRPDLPDPGYDAASLENPDVLGAEMSAAGFRGVEVHAVEREVAFASAEAFWDGVARGSVPIAAARAAMPDDEWRERSRLAVRHVDAIAGPFPTSLGATALLGVGRK